MKRFLIFLVAYLFLFSGVAYASTPADEEDELNSSSIVEVDKNNELDRSTVFINDKLVEIQETVEDNGIHKIQFSTPDAVMIVCRAADINTVEVGWINMVYYSTSNATTSRGDWVLGGYYYVDNIWISWGSIYNPEAFVKTWWDISGRIDINFYHVSVPTAILYTNYSCSSSCASWWDWSTVTINGYKQHRYWTQYCGL